MAAPGMLRHVTVVADASREAGKYGGTRGFSVLGSRSSVNWCEWGAVRGAFGLGMKRLRVAHG